MEKIIRIALDGPSGSGKSTIAKKLSSKLNILYLDTGAMYRATAIKAISLGIDTLDEKGVSSFIDDIDLEIKYVDGTQHTYLDGNDVSEKIREPHVSMAASNISSLKCVRLKMVEMQRKIASTMSCVLDGRDIGSYVLPNADYKFYITASVDVRADRRFKELSLKGHVIDYSKLKEEIEQRDYNDKTREFSPYNVPVSAFVAESVSLIALLKFVINVCNSLKTVSASASLDILMVIGSSPSVTDNKSRESPNMPVLSLPILFLKLMRPSVPLILLTYCILLKAEREYFTAEQKRIKSAPERCFLPLLTSRLK